MGILGDNLSKMITYMIPELIVNKGGLLPEYKDTDINLNECFIKDMRCYVGQMASTMVACDCIKGFSRCDTVEYGYADTEEALYNRLKSYNNTKGEFLVELSLVSKEYENYHKMGKYILSDGSVCECDYWDYIESHPDTATDYDDSWVCYTVYSLILK